MESNFKISPVPKKLKVIFELSLRKLKNASFNIISGNIIFFLLRQLINFNMTIDKCHLSG